MKNYDVINLVNNGVLSATTHTMNAAQGYKAFKFKKAIRAAFNAIQESEKDLLAECGIEDAQAHDNRMMELRSKEDRTDDESKELDALIEKTSDYLKRRAHLYEEEATLDGIKTMPYEDFKNLQDENKEVEINGNKYDVFSGAVEELLEGVLWVAPEED